MARCDVCHRDMLRVVSCVPEVIVIGDKEYSPIPYGEDRKGYETAERCHDCGVVKGGYHHPGCDMEECPKCGWQLISCGCLDGD
jgi:hypothetical protein